MAPILIAGALGVVALWLWRRAIIAEGALVQIQVNPTSYSEMPLMAYPAPVMAYPAPMIIPYWSPVEMPGALQALPAYPQQPYNTNGGKLRGLEESKVPSGLEAMELTVTSKETLYFAEPLISFTILNDGPDGLYVEINSNTVRRVAPIQGGERFSHDAVYPTIGFITVAVDDGNSASLRLRGKTGTPAGHAPEGP